MGGLNNGFNFKGLFVFDLANNHQGSVEHATRIIRSVGEVARTHGIRAAFKFQFRQMDSFVHPSHHSGSDNKHIPRFLSTALSRQEYQTLLDAVGDEQMLSMCTPFEEESVDLITEMGFDIIKVASCSAKDWPLIERVTEAGLPTIVSTGGLDLGNIDDLVSFFDHRGVDYAIMHCVSIYPIPGDKFNLSQIATLRSRYPDRIIGWSTHEDPNLTAPVQIAASLGAEIFERHVGLETKDIKLNAYSSTPEQLDRWIAAWREGKKLCGPKERPATSTEERDAIDSLRRGVYARRLIKKNTVVTRDQVYFAMPYVEGQLPSGQWKDGIVATEDVKKDGPVALAGARIPGNPDVHIIKAAVHEVKAMLNDGKIALSSDFLVEYSHHYGVKNFREVGAVILTCINREYCKKLIVQLPHQKHPAHYHKLKEETFQVLYGTLEVSIEGKHRVLEPGDTCLIQPGVWHSFWTETGCIFEEVSTTHYNDDSFYKDKSINKLTRDERKTKVDHWGRFQLPLAVVEGDRQTDGPASSRPKPVLSTG